MRGSGEGFEQHGGDVVDAFVIFTAHGFALLGHGGAVEDALGGVRVDEDRVVLLG